MLEACILIKVIPTRVEEILTSIWKFNEIKKAYIVYGRWDIVAFIEISDYKRLKTLTSEINSINGVRSTETLASP
ncbi:MAG: Lrp/AsnC ligand binding domain-containing protein [Candidatus Bathyarchaeota archaeon]|jgi:DNA-binding Lrp family transcriptional regulator|nr:Lrp/AsnC ligand binding domain-containing protein [Candidatus Bathyarchaeota archaeon]MCZ2845195.1 Lrp/AsnC ligand binding domain-containing protein [Candidatus Bathyarchaeota archaeon]